jgi:DNA-binding response OmpR family regulator
MVSRDSMMTLLYSHLRDPPEDHIPVYVSFLRPALKATPFLIQNERGRGYRLIKREELVIYCKKSHR